MNNPIIKRAMQTQPGQRQGVPRLSVFPILGPSAAVPDYRVLDDSTQGSVEVTEVDQSGSVPNLKVKNDLDTLLYLMDGQELVGAKQNRILNTDVMVPARTTLTIPVSCVEAGRWRYMSATFRTGHHASYHIRHRKEMRVHRSLREDGRHDADQHEVWNDVAACMSSSKCDSPTAAMHDVYQQQDRELSEFRQSLHLPDDAVGVAVFRGTTFLGLDLFDRHSTLTAFWQRIVDSYAVDLLHVREPREAKAMGGNLAVTEALRSAALGQWQPFDSPGAGKDYRLEHEQYAGSALVCDDEAVVHLQVFAKQNEQNMRHERK